MQSINPQEILTATMIAKNLEKQEEQKKLGIFFINSIFTSELMENLFGDLMTAGKDNNVRNITVYINSNGGAVDSLMPLIDLLNNIGKKKPVETIVLGKAYSCGAILLLSGTKGCRYAFEHSLILLHEVATGLGYSKTSQIREDLKHLEVVTTQIIDIVKTKTKMSKGDIEKYFDSNKDIFLTSKEALKYGIIDKII